MDYRYRVQGVVKSAFILRGAYFAINSDMDFSITESELNFVKERCDISKLTDLKQKPVDETPAPTPKPKQETKPKEAKANDGARKKVNKQVKV